MKQQKYPKNIVVEHELNWIEWRGNGVSCRYNITSNIRAQKTLKVRIDQNTDLKTEYYARGFVGSTNGSTATCHHHHV